MATTLNHAELGEVKGNVKGVTAQFLGLQYASLANRFAPPQLKTQYGFSIDASKFG
jgi:carboxylesterase type B